MGVIGASGEGRGERGNQPEGHRDQRDRQEVRGGFSNPDTAPQERQETVVQEESDPEDDRESKDMRPGRALHDRPQSQKTIWSFRRDAYLERERCKDSSIVRVSASPIRR